MRQAATVRIPRLYTFVILIAVLFSVVNIIVLYYGKNAIIAIQAIDAWVGVILLALIGSMLIGMYIAYRLIALRAFTPFEREMMEMRVEVAEIRRSIEGVQARLDSVVAPAGGSAASATPPGKDERELLSQLRRSEERLRNAESMLQAKEAELERARLVSAERRG